MKHTSAIVIASLLSLTLSAQNISNTAFDTNGPIGELLFVQNEDGEIVYSGVVSTTGDMSPTLDMKTTTR